ncbi:hypothetical protein V1520DRAFT_350211, partial [Lipomyces starkeyi]
TTVVCVDVGLSQTYESLRAAISISVCALRCRVGIAMSINEGDHLLSGNETSPPETLLDPKQSF